MNTRRRCPTASSALTPCYIQESCLSLAVLIRCCPVSGHSVHLEAIIVQAGAELGRSRVASVHLLKKEMMIRR